MPMLAVVALAAGATAGAVAIGGLALATAVTYVGIGMTVVGAVTGNKNFAKVGGLMSLAGGVMNIAGAAGAAGSGASAAGEGLTSTLADESLGAAADAAGDSFWSNVGTEGATSGIENMTADSFSAGLADTALGTAPADIYNAGAASVGGSVPSNIGSSQGGGLINASMPAPAPAVDNVMTTSAPAINTQDIVKAATNVPTGQPGQSGDKKAWWASLPEETKNEIIKGGLAGAGKFFEGWSASEKSEWEQDRLAEQQRNFSAQPQVMRYKAPTGMGLLNATPKKVGG